MGVIKRKSLLLQPEVKGKRRRVAAVQKTTIRHFDKALTDEAAKLDLKQRFIAGSKNAGRKKYVPEGPLTWRA